MKKYICEICGQVEAGRVMCARCRGLVDARYRDLIRKNKSNLRALAKREISAEINGGKDAKNTRNNIDSSDPVSE